MVIVNMLIDTSEEIHVSPSICLNQSETKTKSEVNVNKLTESLMIS